MGICVIRCLGWDEGIDVGKSCKTQTGLGVSLQRMVTVVKCFLCHLLPFLEKLAVSERRKTQICQCMMVTMTKEHASCPERIVIGQLCSRESDLEKVGTLADNRNCAVCHVFLTWLSGTQ